MLSDLTGFQRDLLYVVAWLGESSGAEIRTALEDELDENITRGRLYPNLDTLVDEGFLSIGSRDRRTNTYAVSGLGFREIMKQRNWENKMLSDTPVPVDAQ